jgi:hypothetical protein
MVWMHVNCVRWGSIVRRGARAVCRVPLARMRPWLGVRVVFPVVWERSTMRGMRPCAPRVDLAPMATRLDCWDARLVLWGRMATRLALAVWCRAWTVLLECMVRWRVWRSAWRVMLASMRPSLPCRSVCRARRVAIRQQWVRPARPCVCCVLREHSAMSWAPRTNPCVRIAVWVRTMRRRVRRHVQVARTEPLRTWRAGWCAWDAWRVASVRWWVRQHRRCARCARRGSMDRWGVWRRA